MTTCITTNLFPWWQEGQRASLPLHPNRRTWFARIAASGLTAIEPGVELHEPGGDDPIAVGPAGVAGLLADAAAAGLTVPSIYLGGAWGTAADVANLEQLTQLVPRLRDAGVRRLVFNPDPISWSEPQDKDDARLRAQAAAVKRVCAITRAVGLEPALHWHDAELRSGGRELLSLLAALRAGGGAVCYDAHWTWSGCGRSQVAAEVWLDVCIDLVSEVHLRQSHDGVWQDRLGDGDLDFAPLASRLRAAGRRPDLCLEMALHPDTPVHDPVTSHTVARAWAAAWLA
jgi:inosose dehydratase